MTTAIHTLLAGIAATDALNDSAALPAIDILGPQVQFLDVAEEFGASHRLMLVSVPPGVCVPLHSHVDPEYFLILDGSLDMLDQRAGAGWSVARADSFIAIAPDARHAFRNSGATTARFLCATTAQMAHFFDTVGEPTELGSPPAAPTPERIARFMAASDRFHYWLGSPDDNRAAGI